MLSPVAVCSRAVSDSSANCSDVAARPRPLKELEARLPPLRVVGFCRITGGLVAAAVGLALIVFNRGIAEKVTGLLGLDPKGHQITDAVKSMASKVGSLAHNAAQHVAAYVPKVTGDLARMVAGFEGIATMRTATWPGTRRHSSATS